MVGFKQTRARVALVLVVVGALFSAVTACAADKPVTESTATGTPIKVGVVATLSNHDDPYEDAVAGFEAWAATTNGKGGLGGHPVEIVVEDDGSDPAKALTAAKRLVEEERVTLLISWSSFVAAWADYANQKEIPVLGGQSSDPAMEKGGMLFPVATTISGLLFSQSLVAKNAGVKRMATFYTSKVPAAVEGARVKEKINAGVGLETVYDAAIDPGQPDFTAACLAAKNAGAEAVVLAGVPAERIATGCDQQGFDPRWVYTNESFPEGVLNHKVLMSNLLAPAASFPFFLEIPETENYRASMDTDYRGPDDAQFGPRTSVAWMTGLVLEEAVQNAGAKDILGPADILAGLKKIDNFTANGLLPNLSYAGDGPRLNKCFWELRAEDGELTAPNGLKTTCAP